MIAALILCVTPIALDGDTIRCAKRKNPIRIVAIDAPELPGHCRAPRVCEPGDPYKSKAALEALMRGVKVRVHLVGKDRYRRDIGQVWAGKVNVSCALIASGHATYKPQWNGKYGLC